MRAKITKKAVDGASADGKPSFVFDTELAGFVLKVLTSGKKVYQLRYRMGGRTSPLRTFTIGNHGAPWTPEQARRQAETLLLQTRQGIDPAAEKVKRIAEDRGAVTVQAIAADFMALHVEAKRKERTQEEYEKLMRRVILPTFGARRLKDILPGDVERWHHSFKATPFQANRALAVFSKFMNWAISRGYRAGENPCKSIEKFKEAARKRYLSPAEIGSLGEAIRTCEADGQISPHVAAFFRVLLLTGMRKDELRLLTWDRVDLERGVLILADVDSKSGARDVPISAPVRQVLASLPQIEGNSFVFVGKRREQAVVNVSKPWARVLSHAGIDAARVHDLRHTAASVGVTAGMSLILIGGVLGHRSSQTTQRYAHLADDPVRATSETIAERIAKALDGREGGDVVPFAKRKS